MYIRRPVSLVLSLGLAAQPFAARWVDQNCHSDICRDDTLVEPPHTSEEPTIPGQRIVVTSTAVGGTNVTSKIEVFVQDTLEMRDADPARTLAPQPSLAP